MAGFDLPLWVIRRQIASAIHLVVQVARLTGGQRKVVRISEITGMEGEVLSMHDLFEFKKTGVDSLHMAQGYFQATGMRPHCLHRFEEAGIKLPPQMFEARILNA